MPARLFQVWGEGEYRFAELVVVEFFVEMVFVGGGEGVVGGLVDYTSDVLRGRRCRWFLCWRLRVRAALG